MVLLRECSHFEKLLHIFPLKMFYEKNSLEKAYILIMRLIRVLSTRNGSIF